MKERKPKKMPLGAKCVQTRYFKKYRESQRKITGKKKKKTSLCRKQSLS